MLKDPAITAAQDSSAPPRFTTTLLPWLDRVWEEIDAYVDELGDRAPCAYDLRTALVNWVRHGFVALPRIVPHEFCDAYLADAEALWAERGEAGTWAEAEQCGIGPLCEMDQDRLARDHHVRIMDFHNESLAGKLIGMHPVVIEFLGHVFRSTIVCSQSLTFRHGTDQPMHQDFPYVLTAYPSNLAGAWVALEDVHPDAGPLGYYPGSHTWPKFRWPHGNLVALPGTVRSDYDVFADHLDGLAASYGTPAAPNLASKGDVFIWHSALAHGGLATVDPNRTRRSVVYHYSTVEAYSFDIRDQSKPPMVQQIGDGLVYMNPRRVGYEDRFVGAALAV